MLQTYDAGVEIRAVTFGEALASPEEETKVLIQAIGAARLLKPKGRDH
jgi:hypothetical protein